MISVSVSVLTVLAIVGLLTVSSLYGTMCHYRKRFLDANSAGEAYAEDAIFFALQCDRLKDKNVQLERDCDDYQDQIDNMERRYDDARYERNDLRDCVYDLEQQVEDLREEL